MFSFLQILHDFFSQILSYDIITGLSIFTLLFYPFLFVLVFTAFTRRG